MAETPPDNKDDENEAVDPHLFRIGTQKDLETQKPKTEKVDYEQIERLKRREERYEEEEEENLRNNILYPIVAAIVITIVLAVFATEIFNIR